MGRADRQPQRRLQDAGPPRAQHARQAPGAGRRLPRTLRAAARTAARAAHPQHAARRAGRHRLFFVGRLHGSKGAVWQITAIDTSAATPGPIWSSARRPDRPSSRPPRWPDESPELQGAGWRLERVLSDNGNEFGRHAFASRLPDGTRHTRIRSGRPQTNGHVERLHRTILEECWRPAFARYLRVHSAACAATWPTTCTSTTSTANTTDASPKAAAPPTSSTVPTRRSPNELHLSAHPGVRSA